MRQVGAAGFAVTVDVASALRVAGCSQGKGGQRAQHGARASNGSNRLGQHDEVS
jgi:hypothetical protein